MLGLPGKIVGIDITKHSPGFHMVDCGVLVPRCTDAAFIPEVLKICKEHMIQLVIPTIDTELQTYAENQSLFAEHHIKVAISSPQVIDIGSNKEKTHAWLKANGFPTVSQTTPKGALENSKHFPCPLIAKPLAGSASIGVQRIDDTSELERLIDKKDYVIQTMAPGIEHTVDVFVDSKGMARVCVPRKRLEVRAGEVSKGITVRSETIETLAKDICNTLPGAYGVITIQIFFDEATGALNVIEINPRFGGGFPLAFEAGAHMPKWIIQEVLGLSLDMDANAWIDDLIMLRYDQAVFVHAKQL